MKKHTDTDYLDEIVATREEQDPVFARQWRVAQAVRPLVTRRKELGLSLREVASRMSTSASVVHRIENRPWSASMERLFAYCEAIGAQLCFSDSAPKRAA